VVADLIARNPTGVYTIEASILSPILDAGRLRAQQGVAAARRNQAAYAYRKSALSAFRDVEDALASTQRLAEQETALVAQRDALAAALRQATARYRAGYSPYLEQLDADRAVLASELTLVQTRADRLNAAVALFQALGGGWDRDPVRRPVGP
jgi:outer membrane protein TolC